jgi:hypothetical protein
VGKVKEESIKQDNNMVIWDKVATTDVDHTKEVSFGRKFTAIDAHYQVMQATKMFGPIGQGWGYDNQYHELHLQDGKIIAVCDVTFWWTTIGEWEGNEVRNRKQFGPIRGAAVVVGSNKDGSLKAVPDTDAWKKASTDGLTKCLSHLGFNADVFLGMFDDNKYVQELKSAKDKELSAKELAYQQDRKNFVEAIKKCKKPEQMDAVLENHKLWMAGLPVATATEMRSWVLKKKTELADGSK